MAIQFRAVALLCMTGVILSGTAQSQDRSPFQRKLDDLSTAINERQTYNQASFKYLVKSQVNTELGRVALAEAPPDSKPSTKDTVYTLSGILGELETGDTLVFGASGIAGVDLAYSDTTSPWKSDQLRNGFDRTKPFLDIAGTILTSTSFALTASNPNGSNSVTSGRSLSGIIGIAAIGLGSALQYFKGANSSELQQKEAKVTSATNTIQADIAQVQLSRLAYNDIQIRLKTVNTYYTKAVALVDPLANAKDNCDKMFANPDKYKDSDVLALIDQISELNTQYQQIADFVQTYTDQLGTSYKNYVGQFPVLAPQIAPAQQSLQTFVSEFHAQIEAKFLKDLPTLSTKLIQLRASYTATN